MTYSIYELIVCTNQKHIKFISLFGYKVITHLNLTKKNQKLKLTSYVKEMKSGKICVKITKSREP